MIFRVVAHDRYRIGRRDVPAGGKIRGRPLGRNAERDLDLADVGREADASTHSRTIARPAAWAQLALRPTAVEQVSLFVLIELAYFWLGVARVLVVQEAGRSG